MELIEQFLEEHRLIDAVAGSLLRYASAIEAGDSERRDLDLYLNFFRQYSSAFHHHDEENLLFPVLVDQGEVPGKRGPIPILTGDHRRAEELVDEVDSGGLEALRGGVATQLVHLLWEHIDKENSVFFPEAENRLVRGGVSKLPGREMPVEAREAQETAQDLIKRWTPLDDGMIRGEGCVVCAAFGETCSGIEKEWWNTWDWQYHRSLDEG